MQMKHQPVCLILSRQNMPTLDRTKYGAVSGVAKGAYVLADAKGGKPDVILMATGTEVGLCIEAYEKLTAEGVKARVVSMPSWELFEQQPESYRESVLPADVTARMSVEQASFMGWAYYTGVGAPGVGMRTFGASAPLKELQKKFGFTPEKVVETAKALLAKTH
jgi:transketolase